MKKIVCLLASIMLVFLLSSCGGSEDSEKKLPLRYSEDEIGIHSSDGLQGIFVANEDGTFSPIAGGFSGYSGQTTESSPKRYIWMCREDDFKAIPELKKNKKLILIYNSKSALPVNFTLEKYEFKGYTVGCHFTSEEGCIYLKTSKALSGSGAAYSLEYINDESEYEIAEINGSSSLPLENIDPNMELLLGLELGKYYEFSFYKGTKYMTMTIPADTYVFQSSGITVLDSPYRKTSCGYFEINLPDNLSSGYYYIAGIGMFLLEGE